MKIRDLIVIKGVPWLEVFPENLDGLVITHAIPRQFKRASPDVEHAGPSPLLVNAAYWGTLNVPALSIRGGHGEAPPGRAAQSEGVAEPSGQSTDKPGDATAEHGGALPRTEKRGVAEAEQGTATPSAVLARPRIATRRADSV